MNECNLPSTDMDLEKKKQGVRHVLDLTALKIQSSEKLL
jgi:hypothetical protein